MQHLAEELSRTRPVLFVEPGVRPTARTTGRLPGACRFPGATWSKLTDTLTVFDPGWVLPGTLDLRAIHRMSVWRAWKSLRPFVAADQDGGFDAIVGWPPSVELAARLAPHRLIYDCLDLFPAFFRGRRRRAIERFEEALEAAASAITVTSAVLEHRWRARHPRVVRIPNGVDAAHFAATPATSATPTLPTLPGVPEALAQYPRPRIGYVGTIGEWLDAEALAEVARRQAGGSLLLIGPTERSGIGVVPRASNVHLLGAQPYASLPRMMAALDVLLIPFRVNELTRAVDPVKLYEYCAAGKPIAATPIDEVVAHGGVCHVGAGIDLADAVAAALAEIRAPDPTRSAARRRLAETSSWRCRAQAFVELLDDLPMRARSR